MQTRTEEKWVKNKAKNAFSRDDSHPIVGTLGQTKVVFEAV